MVPIVDLLVPVLIVLGIGWAAFRSFKDRGRPPARRVNSFDPRAFASVQAEGGSTEPAVPAGRAAREPRARFPDEQRETAGRAPQRPAKSRTAVKAAAPHAGAVRRALRSPDSVRTAFILKEILDTPAGFGKENRADARR